MVRVLSVLVFVFNFVQSFCEVSSLEPEVFGDLTIHCGRSDTSIVNITYYGDIDMMFIEDRYEECSSEEISPAHHVIYNINGRDCGFQELNNTNTWTVTVRLQKGFLVTTADKKVNLVCAYDDEVVGGATINSTYDPVQPQQTNIINTENIGLQNKAQIKDTVITVLSDMIDGQTNVTVEVLDKNGEPVTVLYPDHDFHLRITFPTLLASSFNSPLVEECMFNSQFEENLAYLINNGCGNIRFTNFFNPIEISEVDAGRFVAETAEFKIPKVWLLQYSSISIYCKVIVCKKPLQCSQHCPLPNDIGAAQEDGMLKIDGRTPNLTLKRIWLPSIQPVVANVEKQTGAIEATSYLPYLIIAIVLLVLLIVLTAILFCVIRKQIKANQTKIKHLAIVDPRRPILMPVLEEKKKKKKRRKEMIDKMIEERIRMNPTNVSKAGKNWFRKLQSQQIAGVGYPCLQPNNYLIQTNPNQKYELVGQPVQIVNPEPPTTTTHYLIANPPQNSGVESQNIGGNHPLPRSDSFQSNIIIQPYQSNLSIYPLQNPFGSQTSQHDVGNLQTDDPSQPYHLVSEPFQFVNQQVPPITQTEHYFVTQSPQKSNFGSQIIGGTQPFPRSNSIQSNITMQPYQSNPNIYPQQNPLNSQTHQFGDGSMLYQNDARPYPYLATAAPQPFQANVSYLPSSVNQPFQVYRSNQGTQPMQFVNTGFPPLVSSMSGVPPQTVNSVHPIHVNHPVPTYIGPLPRAQLPRAQSYPPLSNVYGNNVIYDVWPSDYPREVPIGFSEWDDDRHYYPPPWWQLYQEYPVDDDPRYYEPRPRYCDPRCYDQYLYRNVYDDRYRKLGEYPNSYNRPLARTTSLIDVMGSVLDDDRRRRHGRRYYSDFKLNIPRPREKYFDHYDRDRPNYRF